jgi:hypothetical protein
MTFAGLIAAGLYFQSGLKSNEKRFTENDKGQLNDILDALTASFKAEMADELIRFWLVHEMDENQLRPWRKDADSLLNQAEIKAEKYKSKWGRDRKGLVDISTAKYESYKNLLFESKSNISNSLERSYDGLKIDTSAMEKSIVERFPIMSVERLPDEDQRLYDSRVKLEKALREDKRASARLKEFTAIQEKWFKQSLKSYQYHLDEFTKRLKEILI